MKRVLRTCQVGTFIALLSLAFSATAQINVYLDGSDIRSGVKPTFFGVNRQGRNGLPWANSVPSSNYGFASVGLHIVNGGNGHSTAPTVVISGNTGSNATAAAVISGGAVTGVYVTAGGSGYKLSPPVTLTVGGGSGAQAVAVANASGVITAVTATNVGSGYSLLHFGNVTRIGGQVQGG